VIPATRYGRPYRRVDESPFTLDRWRPLRLAVDDATVSADDISLLRVFAQDDELELWHTGTDVEPRFELAEPFESGFPTDGARSVHTVHANGGVGFFGIYGIERMSERAAEVAAATSAPEEEIFNGLAFAAASDEYNCDGFVTNRSYLRNEIRPDEPVAFSPTDAFALIGLVRRARGNDSIGQDLMGFRLEGSTFHFVLQRDLLRDGWPWFSGIVASGSAVPGEDSLVYLGQTSMERFTRVLQIRERLHVAAKGEPTRRSGDETVFQLETLLMFLSASFDAAARIAHLVYLSGRYEDAGWRRQPWREKLRAQAPNLAALADDSSTGGRLLQIVGALRNTIHGEALRAGETDRPGHGRSHFVRVTAREGERLQRLLRERGESPDAWGVHETAGNVSLAADRFVEALIPQATTLLNQLMAATDTTRLPGAREQLPGVRLIDEPAAEWWRDMFSFQIRQRVRLLSGL